MNRDTLQDPVDEPATARALYQVFRYRGLFRDDGSWDTSVYKDENASTLSRNYAAAHLQLAFWYRHHGSLERGIGEMERVARMFPDFTEVQIPLGNFYMEHGDTGKAVELYRKLAQRNPRDPEARYYFGVTQVYQGHLAEALKEFDAAIHTTR
ncbi:MAG: tetratricopeptide repeat protein [Candidatus Eisenbacteria bacterium]|uniref:Tetratricopeptide repeat protein n=1 Tax=Eiseniibacteriota bacterium TaxID=2212470 RepID=A0A538SKJ9_UNCEI|nr:MAG: tetratricopeptide repeat protein [Candidatus Eisenbacteria bacterium]